jgi:hypothetical protein
MAFIFCGSNKIIKDKTKDIFTLDGLLIIISTFPLIPLEIASYDNSTYSKTAHIRTIYYDGVD